MGLFDTSEKRRNTLADLSRGLAAFAGNEPAPAAPPPAALPEWAPWAAGAVVLVLVVVLVAVVKR